MKVDTPILFETLSDEDLLVHLETENQDKVFSILYNRYINKVYFKAISMVKNEADARDLAHDIFIKVFTKIQQYKGNSNLSLWIHSVSVNTCINYITKQNKTIFDSIEDIEEDIQGYEVDEEKLLKEIRLDQLQTIMYKLKEEERLLMIMKYLDGFSIKQMEKILKIGPSAIKMRLLRTREKLCKLYFENYGDFNK